MEKELKKELEDILVTTQEMLSTFNRLVARKVLDENPDFVTDDNRDDLTELCSEGWINDGDIDAQEKLFLQIAGLSSDHAVLRGLNMHLEFGIMFRLMDLIDPETAKTRKTRATEARPKLELHKPDEPEAN